MSDEPWMQLAAEAPLENFEAYLSLVGFKLEENIGTRGAIYRSAEGKSLLLPTVRKIDDYKLRIVSLVTNLARYIGEDKDRVGRSISSIGFDVLKIRTGIGSSSYSVDLDDALDTLHGGYALVDYSAVLATSSVPPAYIHGRRTKRVSEYLDAVRMGQTEPGSFVLTLLLPTSRSADLVGGTEHAISLGQKVSDTLAASLAYSRGALSGGNKAEGRITANFASALAEIVANFPKVEIGVDQRVRKRYEPIQFSREDEEPLRQMADTLAPRVEARRRQISGTVVNMSETRGQKSGNFILETVINDETKNVKVPYTRDERARVIEAYDRKAELVVSLEGTLVRSAGGRYTIENLLELNLRRRGSLT